jgi:hypothetical protein
VSASDTRLVRRPARRPASPEQTETSEFTATEQRLFRESALRAKSEALQRVSPLAVAPPWSRQMLGWAAAWLAAACAIIASVEVDRSVFARGALARDVGAVGPVYQVDLTLTAAPGVARPAADGPVSARFPLPGVPLWRLLFGPILRTTERT